MKKMRTAIMTAALLAASIPSLSTTSEAGPFGFRGGWGGHGIGWSGAGIGLAAGELYGAALAAPYYGYGYGYPYTYTYGYGDGYAYAPTYRYGYAPVGYAPYRIYRRHVGYRAYGYRAGYGGRVYRARYR